MKLLTEASGFIPSPPAGAKCLMCSILNQKHEYAFEETALWSEVNNKRMCLSKWVNNSYLRNCVCQQNLRFMHIYQCSKIGCVSLFSKVN